MKRKLAETGSDELRGSNQKGQIRAMMYKDPEGAPTKTSKSYGKTKRGKHVGGHYEAREFKEALEAATGHTKGGRK